MKKSKNRLAHRLRKTGACAMTAALVSGCGAWQATKNATVNATSAVFVAKVKQMNLVIESRAALNTDGQGQSLPVELRIYQLKDSKTFEKTGYTQLLNNDQTLLKADLLDSAVKTLAPGATIRLSAPMQDDTQFVGIAGFFLDPGSAEWQLSIPKAQWKSADPVRLIVTGNRVELAR
ncbi:type VI secretion system lipoprotein TssJ [Paraburkholderia sp. BL21I4N1]|uniref:type VI secretion system lipoprotein TssJ n=1 Tax=Paraburkholderia sp. BL21I4N1 TaxID=1938801 RepID=UPI000D42A118|nr:type VI secretion system lipoprotein TssJ [Paraburkholderia sp. BL21I4N1]PQV48098.1 type VI secretion system protein VasD [Paraburkholderia sp. BL21I4N1]